MILITGANGFIGSVILAALEARGIQVRGAVRTFAKNTNVTVGDIGPNTNWLAALVAVDTVIHTAARVHVMNDDVLDPLVEFRRVNTEGTLSLAHQAVKTGVKRFIYLSSIKVNGEYSESGSSFSPDDGFIPNDPYGLSKYEAEQGLLALAEETGMAVVIIRPPLVYGPGVKGNFCSLMKWIDRGVPLPLGDINNQRSLVALDNLVSFIIHCIHHPKAVNEIFLISDGADVSTTDLLRKVAQAFDKTPRLIPVPVWLMNFAAKLIGKNYVADRLFDSLQIDSSKAGELLGWRPVITMDQQLKETVEAYLKDEKTV